MRSTTCVLLLLANAAAAHVALRSGEWCFGGCETGVNYVKFNDTGAGSKKMASCESRLRAASLYLCFEEYCEEGGRAEWLRGRNETCGRKGNATLPPFSVIDGYGPDERDGVRRMSAEEAFSWPMLDEVVIPDEELFERAFTTLDAAYYEYYIHRIYGYAMYYFWAVVLAIGISTRLVSLIHNLRHQSYHLIPTAPPESPLRHRTTPSLPALVKRYLTTPALFNNRCAQPLGWCTLPTRLQTLTISAFVALNILVCTVDYRLTDGNLYWPTHRGQLLRYVSDRTGILALMNFPLVWLFGMRNNLLMWLTGWGFGTYNSFHRWVARVSAVQAVVHSVGYTVMICEDGGWTHLAKYLSKLYFWNGCLATLAMCALLVFSIYALRRSHYELFLTLHILLSILVLLTMYYHIAIFPPLEWTLFLHPCLLTWLLDRFLRLARALLFAPLPWTTLASATYSPASHLVTLRVPCPSRVAPRPGAYYYLTALTSPRDALQSHPFTLAYLTPPHGEHAQGDDFLPLSPLSSRRRSASGGSSESDALLHASATAKPKRGDLVFLIRPYNGFTARLAARARSSRGESHVRVLVEGPYGHVAPLHTFPSVLFVVGGTGVAVPLAHLAALLAPDSGVTTLRVVWAVRERAFLEQVVGEFAGVLGDQRVSLEVHVTQEEVGGKDALELGALKGLRVVKGRPDVGGVVGEVAAEAGRERLAVVACGPAKMADQTRRACVDALGRGCKGVEYFEESFKW